MSGLVQPIPNAALVLVDVQKDFMPRGLLAVREGNNIIPHINGMMPNFSHVVCSMDSHPEKHSSFKSCGGAWPTHCVSGTDGQKLHSELNIDRLSFRALKGTNPAFDSYSAFSVDGQNSTGLKEYLSAEGISKLVVCGVATDFCVKATVLDAIKLGFQCFVCREATAAAFDQEGSLKEMIAAGAHVVNVWNAQSIQDICR